MGIASKIVKGGLKAIANKAPRMSEALNPQVGKRLYITQADRTALDYLVDQALLILQRLILLNTKTLHGQSNHLVWQRLS